MKIEVLYDQGTARQMEDSQLVQPPFFVVADGVSPPWNSEHPLLLVDGRPAGAVVARAVCEAFARASLDDSAMAALGAANERVARLHETWSRPLDRPDLLAGASVVAAKLADDSVEIVQVADAIALWRFQDDQVGATENSMYGYEADQLTRFTQIMEEVGGDREAAWERYHSWRCTQIKDHANRPGLGNYNVLNGQSALLSCVQQVNLPRGALRQLIFCSDGLVPFERTRSPQALAEWLFSHYDQGGLAQVLTVTRQEEDAKGAWSYESHCEATAISIRLE